MRNFGEGNRRGDSSAPPLGKYYSAAAQPHAESFPRADCNAAELHDSGSVTEFDICVSSADVDTVKGKLRVESLELRDRNLTLN